MRRGKGELVEIDILTDPERLCRLDWIDLPHLGEADRVPGPRQCLGTRNLTSPSAFEATSTGLRPVRRPCPLLPIPAIIDLNDLLQQRRRARRERPPPEGRPAADRSPRRAPERARRLGAARLGPARRVPRAGRRLRSEAARSLPRLRRARHLVPGRRSAALPRQRVPAARRDLVRVPPDSERGARLRRARASPRRPAARRPPPRPRPRHRRHGRRQDDHGRLDDRAHQPDAAAAHRHDR